MKRRALTLPATSTDSLHTGSICALPRSLSTTSNSYRVGVTTPPEIQINHMATAHRRGALAHAIAAHIARECMHSAVMQVGTESGCCRRGMSGNADNSETTAPALLAALLS